MFGVEFKDAFFHDRNGSTRLTDPLLNTKHPVIEGINPPETMVGTIVTNTYDAVSCPQGSILAYLPAGMNDRLGTKMSSRGTAFGITMDWGEGRILVLADSGLFGGSDTFYPGPGLLDEGDNRQFLVNSFHWLFRKGL